MPKKAKELSALSVAKIKENGRHAVGGVDGLHLRIVDGSRAWVLRVAVGKKVDDQGKVKIHRRDIGLGSFPEVSLSEAREKARELKKECESLGFDSVELTDTGIVYAYLNANTDKKMDRIGFGGCHDAGGWLQRSAGELCGGFDRGEGQGANGASCGGGGQSDGCDEGNCGRL